jgi:predicted nucleic acid-binding protein
MIDFACAPFWNVGFFVSPTRAISACIDPDDDRILECAASAGAHFIVTGDKHLLTMVSFEDIRIVRPDKFLNATGL